MNSKSIAPVVVYGPLRSGTTMIRLMLNGHPLLSAIGESDFIFDHVRLQGKSWEYNISSLNSDRIYQDSPIRINNNLDGRAAAMDMADQIGKYNGGIPVLMLHRHLSICAHLLPDLKVIRLMRDPRDVARSSVGMGWAGNLFHGLDSWLETERSWRTFSSNYPDVPKHVLRYEDLVTDPQRELEKICNFLGIEYNIEMLSYPSHTTYSAPDTRLAFQWKNNLKKHDIQLVEARAGNLWDDCGYERSGMPLLHLGPVGKKRLWLQNKAAVWRHLFRRHGIISPVARGIGRRFGWGKLERAAANRIAENDRRHLK